MIVYLDTSALVKLYINEDKSSSVRKVFSQAKIISSHVIAYVEAWATFSRLKRENIFTDTQFEVIKTEFNADWESFLRIGITSRLIERAADLAEAFGLRAYDSLHLAAADYLRKQTKESMKFACFDQRLNHAAKVIDLSLI